ncbi:MAG: hypothetical protein ACRD1A_03465, partial [Terriglobales bacterium]
MVAGEAVAPVFFGLAAGGLLSLVTAAKLAPWLGRLAPADAWAAAAAAALLATAALSSAWLAARRAARIPAAEALKVEG